MTLFDRFLTSLSFTWLDLLALLLFTVLWVGYQWYTDYSPTAQPRLGREMQRHMREWVLRMVERDNRMVDINVLRNLTRSCQFFASTTMLILGALVALMGYTGRAAIVVSELPFVQEVSQRLWEFKILVLLLIFVYAFFKFTWSIRQFGFCSILVGATQKTPSDVAQHLPQIERITVVVSYANRNFNQGLRAYYFGTAAMSWFLHPALMIAVTLGVIYVLHQREFRSHTLAVLRET
ncbi:MAG: DUF599 domain-containing protein [Betaproteobacteria bacterium]|nr:DUF599 domain-containing protein [Betaproteobacteria bacterium]MDH3413109.1 DUF599 domain-containing protein [Gammaproteobacteria bacterium]